MRECGDCNACCIAYEIEELKKWPHQPCKNLCSKGCSIYKNRPKVCKEYLCAWRESKTLTEDERPDKLGAIFRFRTGDGRGAGFRKCLDVISINGEFDLKARKTIGPWDDEGNLLPTAKYVRNPEKAHRIKPPKPSESVQMRALDEILGIK